jgi:putative transposase
MAFIDQHRSMYGVERLCRLPQLLRERFEVARCTVERLMRRAGLRGVIRGKVVRTTVSDAAAPCPLDRVNRQFRADHPNQLWMSDFTYVSTWQGFVYVAFVIATVCSKRTDPPPRAEGATYASTAASWPLCLSALSLP